MQLPGRTAPLEKLSGASQSLILTDSIGPVLQQRHPDGQCIGQDCGIYWREAEPLKGAEAPDWFYVPNVSPKLNGQIRRSRAVAGIHRSVDCSGVC